jgi:hypothetical protein
MIDRSNLALASFAAGLLWATASSCGGGVQHAVADYCVAVPARLNSEIIEVSSRLGDFGDVHHLIADRSNPALYIFRRDTDGIEIHLLRAMGPHGVVVAFFRFQPNAGQDVLEDLQRFISEDIGSQFPPTDCRQIKNFRIPETWR